MNLGKIYPIKYTNKRLKKRFAFFPKILSNNYKIWWEYYYSYEIYEYRGIVLGGWEMGSPKWHQEFLCSTIKELKDYLRIDYRENKRLQKTTKEFFKIINQCIKE